MRVKTFPAKHLEFIYGANPHDNCYIEETVEIGQGTKIWPGVTLTGGTKIGTNCEIGKNVTVKGILQIGDNVQIEDGIKITGFGYVGKNSRIGHRINNPRIGKNCVIDGLVIDSQIGDNCFIGEGAEIVRSTFLENVTAKHKCGISDARVGSYTNISRGVNVANYDGVSKHKSIIGGRCMIGIDVRIISPVTIGDECFVADGARVDRDLFPRTYFNPGKSLKYPHLPAFNNDGSWYLDGNYIVLNLPILPADRASFYVKAFRKCGQSGDAMQLWLKTPIRHLGMRTPIECLSKEGEKSFACILGECGFPEKSCSCNKK